MDRDPKAGLQGLRVVSFESRRAKEMAELVRRYGGEPIVAPSMREVPLGENRDALELLPQLEAGQFDLLILMTGVGTRTLNEALLTHYTQERIRRCCKGLSWSPAARNPLPRSRGLDSDDPATVPEPNTWREVLTTLDSTIDLRGKRIAIQEYGIPNRELRLNRKSRGAEVTSVPIYRWALPEELAAPWPGDSKNLAWRGGRRTLHQCHTGGTLIQSSSRRQGRGFPESNAFKQIVIGSRWGPFAHKFFSDLALSRTSNRRIQKWAL